eukprot:14544048-Heterocapsa_arctica.AAC.1
MDIKIFKGNNDLMALSRSVLVRDIHTEYSMGGSDICEINTFSGTAISQDKYKKEAIAYELNVIFDTQNVKAAINAVNEHLEQFGNQRLPVMLSETIVDNGGCTLPGPMIEAFYVS